MTTNGQGISKTITRQSLRTGDVARMLTDCGTFAGGEIPELRSIGEFHVGAAILHLEFEVPFAAGILHSDERINFFPRHISEWFHRIPGYFESLFNRVGRYI